MLGILFGMLFSHVLSGTPAACAMSLTIAQPLFAKFDAAVSRGANDEAAKLLIELKVLRISSPFS